MVTKNTFYYLLWRLNTASHETQYLVMEAHRKHYGQYIHVFNYKMWGVDMEGSIAIFLTGLL